MASRPTSDLSWLDALRKILTLEEDHGFDNSAVVGGLDRFIQRWGESIAAYLGEGPRQVEQLLQVPYAQMSPEQRRQWAVDWRRLLDRDQGGPSGQPRPSEKLPPPEGASTPSSSLASPEESPGPAVVPKSPASPASPKDSQGQTRDRGAEVTAAPFRRRSPPAGLTVDAPVDRLRGVDTKLSARLKRLEVSTVRDLLYLFPRRHLDYSRTSRIADLWPGQEHTVIATVWEAREVVQGQQGRRRDTEAVLSDETGNIRVVWFGQRYLARTLKPGARIAISGKVDVFKNQLVFQSPEYDLLDYGQTPVNTGRLVPVYPLTEGLTSRNLRRLTRQGLEQWLGGVDEVLPQDLRSRARLLPLQEAVQQAHYPDTLPDWEAARRRLAFDELLTLQLAVLARRNTWKQDVVGTPIEPDPAILAGFFASLPFPLTGAQQRCIGEIMGDLKRGCIS